MSQGSILVCMLLVLVPLWVLLSRDFVRGLAYAVFLCVLMPVYFRIETPGALPELTVQRLVVVSLCLFWWLRRANGQRLREVPMFRYITVWALVSFISLLGTIDYTLSLKRYLDFTLGLFLFYFIVATMVESREDVLKVLRAAWMGITVVAILAVIEKYSHVNVSDLLFHGPTEAAGGVHSTYMQRILLGAGMAMGWPLALALLYSGETRRSRKILLCISVGLLLAACYFSMSRGPWLASVVAAGVLCVGGSFRIRKHMALLAGITLVALVTHPGVVSTLTSYAEATTNSQSFKGGSFQYRLELWRVAFTEIEKSPWRFLFGYGPASGAAHHFEWELSYRNDEDYTIASWDNDYAYSLYQLGVVGFCATLALYLTIGWRIYRSSRAASGTNRDMLLCIAASVAVLLFMMSNVLIFVLQLYYLFWTLTACGFCLIAQTEREGVETSDEPVLEPAGNAVPELPAGTSA